MSEAVAEASRDRWSSIVLSILLHAALAGIIFAGWWRLQHAPKPPQPTLAIEATVVSARALAAPKRAPAPAPAEKPPEPPPEEAPTPPTPEEIAQKQAEDARREADERAAAEEAKLREQQSQREAEERQQQDTQRIEAARKEAEARRAAEAKRIADEKRVADERRQAEEKRAAEERRVADEKRQADEKRKAEATAREARERAQSESELQKSLQAEERAAALRNSGALASWVAQITARIQRAWIRPPSAHSGLDCTIEVTQVQGGQVTNVRLGACNGDQAVRESIEAAVYRASPLPPPPDPALFEGDLEVRFVPAD